MLPNEKLVMCTGNERRHPMRVELGARVRTTDGKDVGTIDRLIVDPSNNEIKAAVIRKGIILPRDVEVPLSTIEPGPNGSVQLTYTADQVDQLPEFFESNYTATLPSTVRPGRRWSGKIWRTPSSARAATSWTATARRWVRLPGSSSIRTATD